MRDQTLATSGKTERQAIADKDKAVAIAAGTIANSTELAQVQRENTREESLAGAWVDFRSAQLEHQVTVTGVFVTELRGLPWAYFVQARAESLEAAFDDVTDEYDIMIDARSASSLAAQNAINTARTTQTLAVANAQYQYEISHSNASASRDGALAAHLAAFTTAEVEAARTYQVSMATAERDYSAGRAR